jgi:Nuclease-related domain/UvrD-like helicase C-terminal domain/Uncharacterized conserved protein (DUF2075)
MARLIPSFMDDATPPGERDVFNLIASGPDDWVALHSLDLAPWNRQLRTEIDFVVLIPDVGILCLEVKSHEDIRFDGARWFPDSIKRSPFKQACDGRYALQRRLTGIAPHLTRIPVTHCCIFPRSSFDLPRNLSIQPYELMDSREFRRCSSGGTFCSRLKAKMENSIQADGSLTQLRKRLSPLEVESIVEFCVPIQKRQPSRREEIVRREQELAATLREQQLPVMRLTRVNKRVVVTGAAGTGKTMIAIEIARRNAEMGQRVGLLCFNRLVGDWIRQKISTARPPTPNLIAGRAIRVAAEMAGIQIPQDPSSDFWDLQLPDMLEERLTDPEFEAAAQFDYLVVDEAQDLLSRPRLWQALLLFLDGGLATGSFVLFGDFEHQVLSDREEMSRALRVVDVEARPTYWHLSENCRNYRIVGETAVQLSGFGDSVYSGFMRVGGDLRSYDISFYEDDAAQLEQLIGCINEFERRGYKKSEIAILSVKADLSAATRLRSRGYKLRPAWQSGELPSYSSVQAYKGMENKAIILTDIDLSGQNLQRHLFYTGITRATECVRVLCSSRFQSTLMRWLSGRSNHE